MLQIFPYSHAFPFLSIYCLLYIATGLCAQLLHIMMYTNPDLWWALSWNPHNFALFPFLCHCLVTIVSLVIQAKRTSLRSDSCPPPCLQHSSGHSSSLHSTQWLAGGCAPRPPLVPHNNCLIIVLYFKVAVQFKLIIYYKIQVADDSQWKLYCYLQ